MLTSLAPPPPPMVQFHLITGQKPDIVIINEKKKEAHLFELTVPFTTRIKESNELKTDRYDHFLTDINSDYTSTVTAFECCSRGLVTKENKDSFRKLHKFTDRSTPLKTFIKNIYYISIPSQENARGIVTVRYICRHLYKSPK